jgi:hypothetical protein
VAVVAGALDEAAAVGVDEADEEQLRAPCVRVRVSTLMEAPISLLGAARRRSAIFLWREAAAHGAPTGRSKRGGKWSGEGDRGCIAPRRRRRRVRPRGP